MAEETIKPGDVVQVQSGGKKWTVSGIDGDKAVCVDENGKEQSFAVVVLKKATKPTVGGFSLGRRVHRG